MKKEEVIIFGIGGHSKVVFDVIMSEEKYRVKAFSSLDENLENFLGLSHFDQKSFIKSGIKKGIIAIGDNFTRSKVKKVILEHCPEFQFIKAVHASAQIGSDVEIGEGTVVMAGAIINHSTKIKEHVIINTGSLIDHDCLIESYSTISPGVTLGGNVKVGQMSAVCLGASVKNNINIGSESVLGAGSLALKDIGDNVLFYGSPAKLIREREKDSPYLS